MPRLCIAIHDVAPATWPQCERLLALLDACGAPPLTLLVVPDYHRRGRIDADAAFRRALDARVARGDELALHGYVHLDEAPPGGGLDRLRRRLLTAGEGEFAALAQDEAKRRLDAGLDLFARLGWQANGFVAPAWLLGPGARAALRATPLRYTSTHAALEIIDGGRVAAPAISASARSAWRRWSSRRWLAAAARLGGAAPLLRLALHPADARHADLLDAWRATLHRLLARRTALTKSAALGLA
jgi:predicted deacetylase